MRSRRVGQGWDSRFQAAAQQGGTVDASVREGRVLPGGEFGDEFSFTENGKKTL
jgi:hypothetical protein